MANDVYKFALIGNPVSHSLSPALHHMLYQLLDLKCEYKAYKVEYEDLSQIVKKFKLLNFKGFNVTYPYKKDIIKYIDRMDDYAKLIGAVNTVKYDGERLIGYNTDGLGFIRSISNHGINIKDKRICILGAGGTACAIAITTAMRSPDSIIILNRTIKKAEQICEVINSNIKNIAYCGDINDIKLVQNADIIINTTPLGMHPYQDKSPLDENVKLSKDKVVYDVIYNPSQTKFLKTAKAFGCKVINGLEMLIYQGICSEEIWLDIKISDSTLQKIIKELTISKNYYF